MFLHAKLRVTPWLISSLLFMFVFELTIFVSYYILIIKEANMITNAIEFDAKIDADWKISIPIEYREYVSPSPRVILLQKYDNDTHDLIMMSESSLSFWDNEDDKVWDNV
jgi:hypothetical protein